MLLFIIGLVLFVGVHLLPTQVDLRHELANRFGDNTYKVVFSVVSLLGFVLIIYGYGKLQTLPGKNPQLWVSPTWGRHVAFLVMLLSMVLLVASNVPSRIRSFVQHPMLIAIMLWSLAHLLVNGRLASTVLFGTFLAWAIYDFVSVKQRRAMGPLGDRAGTLTGDAIAIVGGVALYVLMLYWGHAKLIGVPLLG